MLREKEAVNETPIHHIGYQTPRSGENLKVANERRCPAPCEYFDCICGRMSSEPTFAHLT